MNFFSRVTWCPLKLYVRFQYGAFYSLSSAFMSDLWMLFMLANAESPPRYFAHVTKSMSLATSGSVL